MTSREGRGTVGVVGLVLGLAVLSGALWLVRWTVDPVRASGDTFWYTRYAWQLAGASTSDATTEAARFTVALTGGGSEAGWASTAAAIDPRYPGIFLERPVYPATAAVLIPLLGSSAMVVSALLAGVLLGVTLGAFVFARTRSVLAAAAATILLYALPSGAWIALLYADGWMLAWLVAALAAAAWYLDSGSARAASLLAAAALLLALTKAANEVVLALGLALTAAVLVARNHPLWRRGVIVAGIAVAVAMAQIVAFQALGLPSALVSIQDLLTRHFVDPDVANPLQAVFTRAGGWVARSLGELAGIPFDPIGRAALAGSVLLVAAGNAVLLRRLSLWSLPWILAASATILVVLLHPVSSEVPRLLAPIWLPVAVGLGLLASPVAQVRTAARTVTPTAMSTTPTTWTR